MQELTKRQQEVLSFIEVTRTREGHSPTLREIAAVNNHDMATDDRHALQGLYAATWKPSISRAWTSA